MATANASQGTLAARRHVATIVLLLPMLVFLGGWFVVPLGQLLLLSFQSPQGTFAPYSELLQSEVFRTVFIGTLKLALFVTAICVVLAYPAAWLLSSLRGFWFSVLVPYAILPCYATMLKVDDRLLKASEGLGASRLTTFWRVYLPLTMPGVTAGAAFVFLLA